MFERPDETYEFKAHQIEAMLADPANPLTRTVAEIGPKSKTLDIGAGNGLLGNLVKTQHPTSIIDGIEPNPHGADIAKQHYRNFHKGFAQDFLHLIKTEKYDFITLNDVIEHIDNPVPVLSEIARTMPAKTRILLSTPNVAFSGVRLSLLKGEFNYVDSGILERTHVRFFTQKTLEKVFAESGLCIQKLVHLQRNLFETELAPRRIEDYSPAAFKQATAGDQAKVYQFFFVLTKQKVKKNYREVWNSH